jgi:hypothetical protein
MKKKFLWVGVIGTIVVGLIALGYAVSGDTRNAASELEDLRKQAKTLGLPTTMDEVPTGSVPEADNAGPLVTQAAERIAIDKEAVADLIVEAGRKPSCAFDWAKVQETGFWKRLKFQECIDATLEDADKQLQAKSNAGFQRKLHAAMVVSRLAAEVPTEEAFRASLLAERSALIWMATKMCEYPEDSVLHSFVQRQTFESRPVGSLQIALRRFYALGNDIGQNREIDGDQRVTWLWARGEFPADPWGRDAVEATHLKGCIKLSQSLSELLEWPGAMDQLERTVDGWIKDARPSAFTLRTTAASVRDLARTAAENEAARRILFVAAGVFKSRLQGNAFPAVSPVKGEMEIDPFTRRPMAFSNPGTGFFLYSVGSDRFDSNGPVDEGLSFNEDIGFRFKAWRQPQGTEPGERNPH